MASKRKPRNKMFKRKPDLLYPISIEEFGSENDPCFGKLNDPRAPECQNCGDCEICAIVQSQLLHLKREKVENKPGKKWKDLEEVEILKKNRIELRIKAKKQIRKMLRTRGTPIKIEDIVAQIGTQIPGITKKTINSIIKKLPEKSVHIKFNKTKNTLSWKV